MPVTQRCNYAGSLGKRVPTRTLARTLTRAVTHALGSRLRRLATLPRRARRQR